MNLLAKTIRARISMGRRIHALSAEGRLSAAILTAVPFLLFFPVSMGSPDYYRGVVGDLLFLPLAVTTGVLIVANTLILRKLVNFRI